MTFKEKLNGSKRHIGTWAVLALSIIGAAIGYGKVQSVVATNKDEIDALRPKVAKVAVVEQRVIGIEKDVGIIRTEQMVMKSDIKEILRAVR